MRDRQNDAGRNGFGSRAVEADCAAALSFNMLPRSIHRQQLQTIKHHSLNFRFRLAENCQSSSIGGTSYENVGHLISRRIRVASLPCLWRSVTFPEIDSDAR